MIPIKVQCGCGQKYAFDVDPVNGQMANAVACPICGADGTAAANEMITQALATRTQAASTFGLRLHATTARVAAPEPPPLPLAGSPRPATANAKLVWHEQLWVALPLGLVAVGGAIGGACGGLAWGINQTVFKKLENRVLKYVVTGLISASAAVLWLVVAAFFLTLFKRH